MEDFKAPRDLIFSGDSFYVEDDIVSSSGGGHGATEPYVEEKYLGMKLRKAIMHGFEQVRDSMFYKNEDNMEVELVNSPLTKICDHAFDTSYLQKLTLPEGVTTIGKYAFNQCGAWTGTLPSTIEKIDDSGLCACMSLTGSLPSSLKYIGSNGCSSDFYTRQMKFTGSLPEGLEYVGDSGCYMCTDIVDDALPSTLSYVGRFGFYNCKGLTIKTVPPALTRIEVAAFYGCDGITEFTLPNTVTRVSDTAFAVCNNLEKVTIQTGDISYGWDAVFTGDKLKTVIFDVASSNLNNYSGFFNNGTVPTIETVRFNCPFREGYFHNANPATRPLFYIERASIKTVYMAQKPTSGSITAITFNNYTELTDIYVAWAEDEVPGAPWGATGATMHYNWTP